MNNRAEGIVGETIACAYMQEAGMRIVCRNYACPRGEIDIIAREGTYWVFCEVKARKGGRMGYPTEAVTPAKITQIVHACEWYLHANHLRDVDVRFDIAAVDLTSERVEYTRSAFTRNDAGRRNRW